MINNNNYQPKLLLLLWIIITIIIESNLLQAPRKASNSPPICEHLQKVLCDLHNAVLGAESQIHESSEVLH